MHRIYGKSSWLHLEIDPWNMLEEKVASCVVQDNPLAFQNLTTLDAMMHTAVVKLIGPCLKSLSVLHLCLPNGDGDVLATVATLTKLTDLSIEARGERLCWRKETFRGLQSLMKLQEFRIHCRSCEYDVEGDMLDDDTFHHVTTCMPDLESLAIRFRSSLTIEAFNYLARENRKLRRLSVNGMFDFERLDAGDLEPMFPLLKSLDLDELTTNGPSALSSRDRSELYRNDPYHEADVYGDELRRLAAKIVEQVHCNGPSSGSTPFRAFPALAGSRKVIWPECHAGVYVSQNICRTVHCRLPHK